MIYRTVWSIAVLLALTGNAQAADITVCASGCQYVDLQSAIDVASPGDVIRLRAGETFTGNVTLRAKSTGSTAFITIRSDAPDSELPAAGVRLVPEGRPGANVALSALPRLLGGGGSWQSVPVVSTEPGAHHYRLQFLDIDGSANLGYETVVRIGENQTTRPQAYSIVLDRVYIHGHPTKGIKRGIALDGESTDVLNSYISDIMSQSDSQAINGYNGSGPFRIINNFLEASGENVMFGGADPLTTGVVPSDIEIRGNHFYKPMEWRNAILPTPWVTSATPTTGGQLPEGTHVFQVVAVMFTGGGEVLSAPSQETWATTGGEGAVALSWSPVAGADYYHVYRGTSAGNENVYVTTAAAETTLLYTAAGESWGSPRAAADLWTSKNLLELKNAQRVTIDGNLFENIWSGFQNGYAIVLTPRNGGSAPWSVVRDIVFTNNIVRNVGSAINILGTEEPYITQPTTNIQIANNLLYSIGGDLGEGRFVLITGGPSNITVDHNTVLHSHNAVSVEGPPVQGFVYTNNLSLHNDYGIHGASRAPGVDTLETYFPSAVVRRNVLAGGDPSVYPADNLFPSAAEFLASFADPASGGYTLVSSSSFNDAGTDGRDIGASMGTLLAAQSLQPVPDGSFSPAPAPVPVPDGDSGLGLPPGWQSQDIGAVNLPGSSIVTSASVTLTGAGADIWGAVDAFHFAYQPLNGDGAIVARVASVAGTHRWTKVGVMIRADTTPAAAHASLFTSLGSGLAFQRRLTEGSSSTHTGVPGTAPKWLKLAREGTYLTASVSDDGYTWTVIGRDAVALPSTVLVGVAVTSHDTSVLATGTFDSIAVTAGAAVPDTWQSGDVGSPGLQGSSTESGGTFTIQGAGADIWGWDDGFHFLSQPLSSDGDIIARVASLSGTHRWMKVGVMMRSTRDSGSAHAFMLVSAASGLAFQRRTVTGTSSTHTAVEGEWSWVRLSRRGQLITAAVSADGQTWIEVGSDTVSLDGAIEVGLAVTSHDATQLATGIFDNVQVIPR